MNCIDDTEQFDCVKNGLRFITGYKYKFTNLDSATLTDRNKKVREKFLVDKSSVIRQKYENGDDKNLKTKMTKKQPRLNFPKNEHFLNFLFDTQMHVYVSVGGKFGVLYFLVTSVMRFAFLPYYRRSIKNIFIPCLHNQKFIVINKCIRQLSNGCFPGSFSNFEKILILNLITENCKPYQRCI